MDIYANSKCTFYSCPTLSKTQKPFLTFYKTPTPTHEISTNTPQITTYTHEMPHEHPARRRGPIHRARILT